MLRVGCLVVFVVLVGVPAVASRYLSVWGTLGVVFLEGLFLLFVLPRLAKFAFKQFAMRLFMTKSRVLRGAAVEVHAVRPTHRPVTRADRDPDAEHDRAERPPALPAAAGDDAAADAAHADGDAPRAVTGEVVGAAPSDEADDVDGAEDDDDEAGRRYVLVDFTLTPSPGASRMQFYDPSEFLLVPVGATVNFDDDPTDGGADVVQLRHVDEDGAEHEVEDKITGPARLRAVFGCPDDLRGRVKFRYYFESFGDFALP